MITNVSLNIQWLYIDRKKLKPVPEGDMIGLIKFVDQVKLS